MRADGRKRKASGVRRQQIVEAAQKLIVRYGSEHITIKRIARETGITDGAIYRHFKNKKDILMLIADNIADNLLSDVDNACAGNEGDHLEILHAVLGKHVSLISQRKGVSFLAIAEIISYGDKKLNRKMLDVINNYIASIKEILTKGVQSGEIKAGIDIEKAATLFFSILQGVVHIWALGDFKSDLEKQVEPLWHFFKDSIQAG